MATLLVVIYTFGMVLNGITLVLFKVLRVTLVLKVTKVTLELMVYKAQEVKKVIPVLKV